LIEVPEEIINLAFAKIQQEQEEKRKKILSKPKYIATGEGMNQGFVTNDGESYFKYKRDLIVHLREYEWEFRDTLEKLIDTNDLTDDEFLEYCYNDDVCYYTEWEDEDDYEWEEINGELTEIPEAIRDLAFARIQQEHQEKIQKILSISKSKSK
jgi:hypothetical protein